MSRVLMSGATGLIGSELSTALETSGHQVIPLSRSSRRADTVRWDPREDRIETEKLSCFDVVVHLAGESVMGRWTATKKREITDSRVRGTRLLSAALAALPEESRPQVFVAASATGYYGDRGDDILTEDSAPGAGFLPTVCQAWEAASDPARDAGIRVVHVRIGLVLTPKGGLLAKLLPLFQIGLGGRVGDGRQWMSWIAIDDLIDIFQAAVREADLSGPVNAVAPNPVTNAEFTQTLSRTLKRPAVVPVPRFAVRLALGQAADELALASARVLPARLLERDHRFRHAELEPALRFLLGRSSS